MAQEQCRTSYRGLDNYFRTVVYVNGSMRKEERRKGHLTFDSSSRIQRIVHILRANFDCNLFLL